MNQVNPSTTPSNACRCVDCRCADCACDAQGCKCGTASVQSTPSVAACTCNCGCAVVARNNDGAPRG